MPDVLELIQQQDWLKPVEEGVQSALKKVFPEGDGPARDIENFLHGVWMRHPLHAAVTDVPIGAFSMALVFDLAGMKKAADISVAVGIVGAVAAAVTGLTDWKDTYQRDRRAGALHGILNTVATGLYVGSLIARRKRDRTAGQALSYAGYAVMSAAAWIGGAMVYKYRTGVDRSYEVAPPIEWTPVLAESELVPNQARKVEVAGFGIFLLKKGEKIYTMGNACSHRGGPLNEGELQGNCVVCPWHGSSFDLQTAEVVNGPATHPQPRFDLRVLDGQIEVKAVGYVFEQR